MNNSKSVVVLGAGVIGASWTALFLSAGYIIRVYDPVNSDAAKLRSNIEGSKNHYE